MRGFRTFVVLASGLPLLLGAATALAHVDLISPTPRLQGEAGGNQLKTKPCGQTTNARTTDKVTTFAPGQKVDIKIKEYVQHPGYFAVAFDPDGDDSFPFPRANMDKVVAATDDPKAMFPIGDTVLGLRTDKDMDCYAEPNHECTIPITIPNMTCSNCTLQVTQFMYDKLGDNNDNEYYYQCADIKIQGAAGGTGGAGGAASAGSGSGGTASSAGAPGTGGAAGGAAGGSSSGGTGNGTAGSATGISGTTTTTAGTTTTSAGTSTGTSGAGGSGTVTTPGGGDSQDDGGCGISRRTQGSATALAALGLLLTLVRRRRAS